MELSPIAMIVHRDGLIQYANQACKKLLGASSLDELMEQPIIEFSSPEYRDAVKNRIEELNRTGIAIEPTEEKIFSMNGKLIDVEVTGISVRYDGKLSYLMMIQDITKGKQAEEALRNSEEKYRLIAENMSDLVGILDANGVVKYASPSHHHVLGVPPEMYEGNLVFDVAHTDDKHRLNQAFDEMVKNQTKMRVEFRLKAIGGNWLWMEAHGRPIFDEHGNLLHFLAVVRDITERKQAEEELIQSEEQYRLIAENMKDMVCVIERGGQFKYASPSHEWVLGFPPEMYIGKRARDWMHPDDFRHVRPLLDRIIETKDSFVFEFRLSDTRGNWVWLEGKATPVFDEDDVFQHFLVVSREITEKKQVEEDLRLSEERYRLLAENSTDLIFVTDPKGVMIYSSPSFDKVLGIQPSSLVGILYYDLADPTEVPTLVEQYQAILSEKKPTQWVFHLRNANGESVPVECNVNPMLVDDEEIASISFVARDIRHRIEARKELEENEKKYSLIANNSSDLICLVNAEGVIIFASPSHFTFLGIESERYIGKSYLFGVHPDDLGLMKDAFQSMFTTRNGFICEYRRRRNDGSYLWVESTGTPVFDERGNVSEVVMVSRDIRERKQNEERLAFFAHHDALTELPNRRLWKDRLDQAVQEAERYGRKMAVMMLDIDRFKSINDTLGHDVGDELLKQFAQRVQGCLRESDTFARQGGDEFTILLPDIEQEQDAVQVAQRILSSLQEPWEIGENSFTTTSSIGVAFYSTDATARRTLMKFADEALYAAKDSGRNNVKTYSE